MLLVCDQVGNYFIEDTNVHVNALQKLVSREVNMLRFQSSDSHSKLIDKATGVMTELKSRTVNKGEELKLKSVVCINKV